MSFYEIAVGMDVIIPLDGTRAGAIDEIVDPAQALGHISIA